jgi:two-component system sensor histidine kinase AgrC
MVLFNNIAVKAFSINTLMITFILMIKKFVSYDKVLGNNGINIQLIYFYLISSLIYILVIKCVWEADYTIIEKNIVIFIVILLVYMAINFKFLKALISLIEEKKNLEAYNRYSKMTIDLVNDVKSKQHDFKNHLSTIYGIAQVSNEEDSKRKIKEYIEGLNESLSKEQYIISLDNRVLAGIIYSKLQRAEEMDIKFKYSINSDTNLMPVKDFELAEILFNLLDNAFEAVAKQDSSRWVELNIDREKENSIIHVRNSGVTLKNTNINEIFKKGFSTKGSQRGFGLYNIKSIVDKYGGSIEITTHNYITEFRLVFH